MGVSWRRWLPAALAHAAGAAPLALLLRDHWQGLLIIDPVGIITARAGQAALIMLLLSLTMTPVQTLTGWRFWARLRRPLGLYAFLYAGLHFLTFVGLDYRFNLAWILEAIFLQRYVIVGFAAGLILLLLAATSSPLGERRIGRQWKALHRLAYLAGALAVAHYLWLGKDIRQPLRYAAALILLLVLRLPPLREALERARRRIGPLLFDRGVEGAGR